jgi:hypothetical protein
MALPGPKRVVRLGAQELAFVEHPEREERLREGLRLARLPA